MSDWDRAAVKRIIIRIRNFKLSLNRNRCPSHAATESNYPKKLLSFPETNFVLMRKAISYSLSFVLKFPIEFIFQSSKNSTGFFGEKLINFEFDR